MVDSIFRIGGALGFPSDPLLATNVLTQGLGFPLRPIDVGLYALPGYGGIENIGASQALSDITSTPQVLPAIVGAVSFPQLCVQDIANDSLIFNTLGIWQIAVSVDLTFVGVNAARQINAELYNKTDDLVVVTSVISVGRNAEGSSINTTLLMQVSADRLTDEFQIRILSTADTFTTVGLDGYSFSAIHIDRLRTS